MTDDIQFSTPRTSYITLQAFAPRNPKKPPFIYIKRIEQNIRIHKDHLVELGYSYAQQEKAIADGLIRPATPTEIENIALFDPESEAEAERHRQALEGYEHKNQVVKSARVNTQFKELKTRIQQAYMTNDARAIKNIIPDISQFIINNFHLHTLRTDEKPEMYIYNQGIYVPEGRTYIKEICNQIFENTYRKRIVQEVIDKVEAETYTDPEDFFEEADPRYLCLQNGIYDIKTEQLIPFTPEKRFLTKIHAQYEPDAQCQEFKAFLKEILPNKSDIDRVQELFGLILYRKTVVQQGWMLIGEGSNGKTTLMNIAVPFVGKKNTSEISLSQLDPKNDKFSIAQLHKKLVNISDEEGSSVLQNTEYFKRITGGGEINAQQKFKTPFSFVPYCTMIFMCNRMPPSRDNTDAFFRRWQIIDFPYQFLDKRTIEERVNNGEEPAKYKEIDPQRVKGILESEKEMSGILNWAIVGLKNVLKNKQVSHSATVDQMREIYQRKANPFLSFCENYIEPGEETDYIIKSELRKAVNEWKKQEEIKHNITDKTMLYTLQDLFGASSFRPKINVGDEQVRVHAFNYVKFRNTVSTLSSMSTLFDPTRKLTAHPIRVNRVDTVDTLDTNPKNDVTTEKLQTFIPDEKILTALTTHTPTETADIILTTNLGADIVLEVLKKLKEQGLVIESRPDYWLKIA